MTIATAARAAGPRHFLGLADLSPARWSALLDAAERLAPRRAGGDLLAGKRLGLLLLAPSLRTRTTFELAAHELGAHVVHLPAGDGLWGLEHRAGVVMDGAAAEHLSEALGVLGRLVDGLGIRCFAGLTDAAADARDEFLTAAAAHSPVPVLSLESAREHPHQGLADALTVRRLTGGQRVKVALSWAPHVKPLPLAVPHSSLLAYAREGHDVVLAHPPGFELDEGVLAAAQEASSAAGGTLTVTHDRGAALDGARVVHAKSWGRRDLYGDADAGAAAVAAHPDWIVRADDLARGDAARFLHCLPVRRGVVVEDAVLDGPASAVLDLAEARLHVQKATLVSTFSKLTPEDAP